MGNLISNVQDRFKTSTNAMGLMAMRIVTGAFLGITLALVGKEIMQYEDFSFILVTAVVVAALMRISRHWTWANLFIFNLICVLIGLLLRMYILVAPGV